MKTSRFYLATSLVGALACTTLGCQQTRELKEMHDATTDMAGTTKDMSKTTKDMSQTTKDMSATTKDVAQTSKEMKESMSDMSANVQTTADQMGTTNKNLAETNKGVKDMAVSVNGLGKKLDDTKDTMGGKLDKTNDNLNGIIAQTVSLDDSTVAFCSLSTHAMPKQIRDSAWATLISDPNPFSKAVQAAGIFEAFDYQQWNVCAPDTIEHRKYWMAQATDEFISHMIEFVSPAGPDSLLKAPFRQPNPLVDVKPKLPKVKVQIPFVQVQEAPQDPTRTDDAMDEDLNALAVGVDYIDGYQVLMLKRVNEAAHAAAKAAGTTPDPNDDLKPVSMYSMMEDALRYDFARQQNPQSVAQEDEYITNVLKFKKQVVALLQIRHNYLPAVFLSFAKASAKLSFSSSWILNLDDMTPEELNDGASYLARALETRKLLSDIGIKPVLDPLLRTVIAYMDPQGTLKTDAKNPVDVVNARKNLIHQIYLIKQ